MKYTIYLRPKMDPPNPDWFKVGSVWRLTKSILMAPVDSLMQVENQTNHGLAMNGFKLLSGSVVVVIQPTFTETSVADYGKTPDFYGFEIRLLDEGGKIGDRHLYVESEEQSKSTDISDRKRLVWQKSWEIWNLLARPFP